jgi:hypothetical protein
VTLAQGGKSSAATPARKAVAHRETENHVKSTRAISSLANQLRAALPSLAYVLMGELGQIELAHAQSRILR